MNSQRSTLLHLLSAEISGVHHHHPVVLKTGSRYIAQTGLELRILLLPLVLGL